MSTEGASMTNHDVEQLALFLNGRDTQESGTARWDKLPIDARDSYLKDAEAIFGAVRMLGWVKPEPPTADDLGTLARLLHELGADDHPGRSWDAFLPDAEAVLAAGFRRQGPITDTQVEAAWRAGAAIFGDFDDPGGRDLRGMRAALEAARAVS